MKKIIGILSFIIIVDILIFSACIKACNNSVSYYEVEYIQDKAFTKRCHSLESLLKDAPYKKKGKINYYVTDTLDENVIGQTRSNEKTVAIIYNSNYDINDMVIIHEMCHAVLVQNGIGSYNHDSPEWKEMCSYFRSLGYDVYENGKVPD